MAELDGKSLAAELRQQIASEVAAFKKAHARAPALAVVLVGDDAASAVYVRNKGIATREVGMESFEYRLPADTPQADVLARIAALNEDAAIDGILVQFPLPEHIAQSAVIDAIRPEKDVDGLHPINAGRLASNDFAAALAPCTPQGCILLAQRALGDLVGAHAVVVGRSNLVGKPLAQLLLRENATVTLAHSHSRDLPALCRQGDILVAAVGRPKMVKGDWVKSGACVIDVGINRVEDSAGKARLVGDVDFAAARQVAAHITPVPGGVGPMTIACLLQNTLTAAKRRVE